jgi:hypothetical protein
MRKMGVREEIQKRIDRKRSEINDLQAKMRDAEIYIQALEDTIKILPRDAGTSEFFSADLRTGSKVARARDYLLRRGNPRQIMDILEGIGEAPTKENRAALSGSLSAYVRKGEVFSRPAPNVFGLLELNKVIPKNAGPPLNFGNDELVEDEAEDTEQLPKAPPPRKESDF